MGQKCSGLFQNTGQYIVVLKGIRFRLDIRKDFPMGNSLFNNETDCLEKLWSLYY